MKELTEVVWERSSEKTFLEDILYEFEGHFITAEDESYVKWLLARGINQLNYPLAENQVLHKIIKHLRHNGGKEKREYEVLNKFRSVRGIKTIIPRYKRQPDLSRYLHDKDCAYLDLIVSCLSGERNLSAKQVLEMERIFTKANQRKANEDIGVVYFDPSGFSPGNKKYVYRYALSIVNFALGRGMLVKTVSGEDVLQVWNDYFAKEGGMVNLKEKLENYIEKNIEKRKVGKSFEEYIPILELLEDYLSKIKPGIHEVRGLMYAAPKGMDMPFPNACEPTTFK